MLLPSTAACKKGAAVTLTCQWGHPFEHQLFDTPPPVSLTVRTPQGKKTDLIGSLQKHTDGARDKLVTSYRSSFTPEVRGDHTFVLQMPPIWMEEDREFLEDRVQVLLHVQAQKGWDTAGDDLPWEPLTRPYGLQPGMVLLARAKGLAGAMVEIERYNPTPPADLPPDEFITRTAKTDSDGVVTATLTDAGWWCLSVSINGGTRLRVGKAYPLRRRSILWVFVDEKPGAR
jgi:uncharacterized GH25 family protein